jgi:hypothetical protein
LFYSYPPETLGDIVSNVRLVTVSKNRTMETSKQEVFLNGESIGFIEGRSNQWAAVRDMVKFGIGHTRFVRTREEALLDLISIVFRCQAVEARDIAGV